MNVRVRIQFKPPTEEDWQALRSLAASPGPTHQTLPELFAAA
jgi:hypothetical protein